MPWVLAFSLSAGVMALLPTPVLAAETDLAQLGSVTASASQSDQDGTFSASNAIDGDPATRWASGNGPDDGNATFTADLMVDLEAIATITSVDLRERWHTPRPTTSRWPDVPR